MKIVHVVVGLGWTGGIQEYVAGLSRGLTDLGHEVVILCGGSQPPAGPQPHALAQGLNIVWHPIRRVGARYAYPTGLVKSLRRYSKSADIVHVHQAFFAGTWLAVLSRRKIAATLYLHPEYVSGKLRRSRRCVVALLVRRANLVVAVSQAELDLISALRTPRCAGVVWPALAHIPQPESPSIRRPLVLAVGRLNRSKHSELLIRACALLPPGVEVAIVGSGRETPEVKAIIDDAGLQVSALRGGDLSDEELEGLFHQATVFVSPSRQESFGIAPLKGIAHGCGPLLSDIPSHREIVTTLGFDAERVLFDPDIAATALAERIRQALTSPIPLPRHPEKIPTWAMSAHRAAALYAEVLGVSSCDESTGQTAVGAPSSATS